MSTLFDLGRSNSLYRFKYADSVITLIPVKGDFNHEEVVLVLSGSTPVVLYSLFTPWWMSLKHTVDRTSKTSGKVPTTFYSTVETYEMEEDRRSH